MPGKWRFISAVNTRTFADLQSLHPVPLDPTLPQPQVRINSLDLKIDYFKKNPCQSGFSCIHSSQEKSMYDGREGFAATTRTRAKPLILSMDPKFPSCTGHDLRLFSSRPRSRCTRRRQRGKPHLCVSAPRI